MPRSHADERTANRRWGRARRGQRARGVVFFQRGTRYSALGVLSLLGMIDVHIVQGGYNAEQFMVAFKTVVLPQLNAYPQDHSVLILDNCPGLHQQLEMVQLVRARGARVEWLEPYDPEHNPIEIAFRTAKAFMRTERERLEHLPRRERLRQCLLRVNPAAARSHLRECGFDV